jgi:hypothetical protein
MAVAARHQAWIMPRLSARAPPARATRADRGTLEGPPAAPCPAACGRPAAEWIPACGRHRGIAKIYVILFIIVLENVADPPSSLILVLKPFVACVTNVIDDTFGARAPSAAATPRRYRLPTVLSRGGRGWLTCKAFPRRGLLHGVCKKFHITVVIPLLLFVRAPRAMGRV